MSQGKHQPSQPQPCCQKCPCRSQQELFLQWRWCEDRDGSAGRQLPNRTAQVSCQPGPRGLHPLLPRRGLCYLNTAFPISLCFIPSALHKPLPRPSLVILPLNPFPFKYRWLNRALQDGPVIMTETPQPSPTAPASPLWLTQRPRETFCLTNCFLSSLQKRSVPAFLKSSSALQCPAPLRLRALPYPASCLVPAS